MAYWNSVLNEVLCKDENAQTFLYTNNGKLRDEEYYPDFSLLEEISEPPIRRSRMCRDTPDLREYYLGDDYPDIYLTKREAESMFWIVQGSTIPETARKLGLSSRTVEFYVKNLKLKLHCSSKKELMDKILQTSLLKRLEEKGLRIVKH